MELNSQLDSGSFDPENNISPPIFVPNPNYSADANNKVFEVFQEKKENFYIIDCSDHCDNYAFESICSLDKNQKKRRI